MGQTAYDSIAGWYDALVRADSLTADLLWPDLLALMGDVEGRSVCDLACGQGRIARWLAQRGARVIGVDNSQALIKIARAEEAARPLRIRYHVGDAQNLAGFGDTQFDGVVCNLALMDIPDLAAVYRNVRRILRLDGWFVFSITHPCFQAPDARWRTEGEQPVSREVVGYFDEGYWRSDNPEGVRGRVGAYHRTLATYLNSLVQTGFVIQEIREPAAHEGQSRHPGHRIVPPFLLVQSIKEKG